MTPSTDNPLSIVKRGYELFGKGDIDTLVSELFAPSLVWVQPEAPGLPGAGTNKGPEKIRKNVFDRMSQTYGKSMKMTYDQWLVSGNTIIVTGTFAATVQATGRSFKSHFAHVNAIENGRLVHFQSYFDTAPVRAALGQDISVAHA